MTKQRKVNRGLDIEPLILFIPADMFLPWSVILGMTYLVKQILELNWFVALFIAGWGMATWWVLTYKGAWTFLSKFIDPPHYIRAQGTYKNQSFSKKKIIKNKKEK